MNKVKLTYNPYIRSSKILINDAPVSAFSEVTNYLLEPFDFWCDKLLNSVAAELNDEFKISFASGKLETLILKTIAQNRCEDCISFEEADFENKISLSERIDVLNRIQLERKLQIMDVMTASVVFTSRQAADSFRSLLEKSNNFSVDQNNSEYFIYMKFHPTVIVRVYVCVNEETDADAHLCFFADSAQARNGSTVARQDSKPKMFIAQSDKLDVIAVSSNKYVLAIPDNLLADIFSDLLDFLLVVPAVVKAAERYRREFSESDGEEIFRMLTEVDPIVIVDFADHADVGESITLDVTTVPENSKAPSLRIYSSNERVVSASGNSLFALESGEAIVKIFAVDNLVPLVTKRVTVIKKIRIERIDLEYGGLVLERGTEATMKASVYPQNSENICELRWSTSNAAVAVVDANGVIKSTGVGECEITLSAGSVFASCSVTVKAAAERIVLPDNYPTDIKSVINQNIPYTPKVYPVDAYNTEIRWQVYQDNDCIRYDGNNIHTNNLGKAAIEFSTADGKNKSRCRVEVISTLYKKANPLKTLAFIIIVVAAILCAFVPIAAMAVSLLALGFSALSLNADKKNVAEQNAIIGNMSKASISGSLLSIVISIAVLIFSVIMMVGG